MLKELFDVFDPQRHDGRMGYRRCGRSGLLLPEISLGCWHNFGGLTPTENQRMMLRTAFDCGSLILISLITTASVWIGRGECRQVFGGVPARRVDHLEQGGLRHVAGALRRMGLTEIACSASLDQLSCSG
ncbi:MAG: hypothetical protein R3B96_04785 [Pirellulaceae bacterium]